MNKIELRFGPKDGRKLNLIDSFCGETIIIGFRGREYLYRRTGRMTREGRIIYQFINMIESIVEV